MLYFLFIWKYSEHTVFDCVMIEIKVSVYNKILCVAVMCQKTKLKCDSPNFDNLHLLLTSN